MHNGKLTLERDLKITSEDRISFSNGGAPVFDVNLDLVRIELLVDIEFGIDRQVTAERTFHIIVNNLLEDFFRFWASGEICFNVTVDDLTRFVYDKLARERDLIARVAVFFGDHRAKCTKDGS